MFCPNCGGKIEEGMKFCPYCGQAIEVKQKSSSRPDYSKNPYENENNEFIQPEVVEEPKFDNNESQTVSNYNPYDKFAHLSYTFGLIGIILGVLPLLIVSLVFSKKGMQSIEFSYKAKKAKTLAIIGIVLWSIVEIFLSYYITIYLSYALA